MNLVIDIGNTFIKLAVFKGSEMVSFTSTKGEPIQVITDFCISNPLIKNSILSSVTNYDKEINNYLTTRYGHVVFSHSTPVPIVNTYQSPTTLGLDRLAAAVGAKYLFPASNVLVIDAGTAITFEMINHTGEYLGGAISPGILTRYRALNTFTGKLPLLEPVDETPLIGTTTETCIHTGIMNGIVAETDGIISRYNAAFSNLMVVITGGDYKYFDKRLKIKTFAAPNLVLEGLNQILAFNIETN